jgi:tripeptidyl-peptidase I
LPTKGIFPKTTRLDPESIILLTPNRIEDVIHSDTKGWIAFNAPTSIVEKLFHTEYYEHHDLESGGIAPACDQYHVPKVIQEHIDYVTPGVKLLGKASVQFSGTTPDLSKRFKDRQPKPPLRYRPERPAQQFAPPASNLSTCDEEITPACVAALYQIPQSGYQLRL